jgi:hypothetical protein
MTWKKRQSPTRFLTGQSWARLEHLCRPHPSLGLPTISGVCGAIDARVRPEHDVEGDVEGATARQNEFNTGLAADPPG